MKSPILPVLILLLSSGCASCRFSANEGIAKFAIPFDWPYPQKQGFGNQLDRVYVGMSKSDLYDVFKGFQQKGYQKKGNEEWITFSARETEAPGNTVTFYLVGNKVKQWERE